MTAAYHVHFNYDIKSRARFESPRTAERRAVKGRLAGGSRRSEYWRQENGETDG